MKQVLAYNADLLRKRLWERVAPPVDMLNKALAKLDAQLDAKETKFFSKDGIVIETREVDALDIQQRAAVAIARVADAMPRDRAERATTPAITFEIRDGRYLLHIGATGTPPETEVSHAPLELKGADNIIEYTGNARGIASDASPMPGDSESATPPDESEAPTQFIRIPRATRREALRILMGESG